MNIYIYIYCLLFIVLLERNNNFSFVYLTLSSNIIKFHELNDVLFEFMKYYKTLN